MMVSRDGAFGKLMGAVVGTLFLVPAHGCAGISYQSLEDVTRCAEQGYAPAQYNLGVRYSLGEGVPKDDAEAVRWIRLAAEQGDAVAQNLLGMMYNNGRGVPEDDIEAIRWYRLAAEQGHTAAQFNLGGMYARGEGVPEDLVLAYMWWDLSAAQGTASAQRNKEIIERRMTREQIAEAQRLSREWIEAHPPPQLPPSCGCASIHY